ncbi:hypothetical protein [Kitasatospora viridis]|uniref:Tachylectin n=1 Tax=Kitasatospora viridis TaxID=281105 RepID=A0A561TWQ3_9ACTN|nr:hypothetical protein [Kitasatospora viridis]TWF91529.1 hypothetical protein FHX73_12644 [Kitasatospora viridis]
MKLHYKFRQVLFTAAALVIGGVLVAGPATAADLPTGDSTATTPQTLPIAASAADGSAAKFSTFAELSPGGNNVNLWAGNQSWMRIGGPATGIFAQDGILFDAAPHTGEVSYYSGSLHTWVPVGGPVAQLAVDGQGHLFALTPNRDAVLEWQSGTKWVKIGGPATSITGGSAGLLVSTPGTGGVVRYAGSGWTWIGGPGAEFTEDSTGHVYGLNPARTAVTEWTGGTGWKTIGGPATSITGGTAGLVATAPGSGDLVRYTGSGWTKIGGPAAQIAETGDGWVVALTPNKSAVVGWKPGMTSWAKLGGPAEQIAAS